LSILGAFAVVGAVTMIGMIALDHRLADIIMLYILGLVLVATRLGYTASLIAATASVLSVDFFFTPPYFSLAIADKSMWLTLIFMLVVALVIGNQTERLRKRAGEARERERGTAKLYSMSQELTVAPSSDDIARAAYRHLREIFSSDVWVLLTDPSGKLAVSGKDETEVAAPRAAVEIAESLQARETLAFGLATGERLVALCSSSGMLGVLILRPSDPNCFADAGNRNLLDTFAVQIALSLERCKLSGDAQRAQVEVQTERLRNALLSSVSHDLRGPLAVVKASATALLEADASFSEVRKREYLQSICDEASRLNSLVGNVLHMASLEVGALRAHKEWQPLEETIGVALQRSEEQLKERVVHVVIEPNAALALFDRALIEQVFVNLIENAIRYTPEHVGIDIFARRSEEGIEITVADRGPGVPTGQEERVFEKFYRAARTGAGMGLGLAICRGIVSAHSGTIWCQNRAGGGAAFSFVLPSVEQPPDMKELPDVAESA
jgi:two-component system sensor histidine kinase KdpD